MDSNLENMEDIAFCYTCLNENKPVDINLIERYLKNRQNLNSKTQLTKEEIFKYLSLTLSDIKNKRKEKTDYFKEDELLIL